MIDVRDEDYGPGPYCVVSGSVSSGFCVYGSFDTVSQAVEWAESKGPLLGFCSVMPLNPPT